MIFKSLCGKIAILPSAQFAKTKQFVQQLYFYNVIDNYTATIYTTMN